MAENNFLTKKLYHLDLFKSIAIDDYVKLSKTEILNNIRVLTNKNNETENK